MNPTDHKTGLTQERLRTLLHYEPATGVFTWLVARPNGVKPGDVAGSLNSKGYRIIKVSNRAYKAARLAHLYMTGEWPPVLADHENRDRADNRWENVRAASHSQNCANRLVFNSTGFKGVIFRKSRNAYEAYLKKDGRRRYLGYFRTPQQASAAYAIAAAENFGAFARS